MDSQCSNVSIKSVAFPANSKFKRIAIDDDQNNRLSTSYSSTKDIVYTRNKYIFSRRQRSEFTENFILIWIDPSIKESDDNIRESTKYKNENACEHRQSC
jgi:hypothetical protein